MKVIKIFSLFIIAFGTLVYALYTSNVLVKKEKDNASNIPKTSAPTSTCLTAPRQYFEEQLTQEEKKVWINLEKIGIKREEFDKFYKKCCDYRKNNPIRKRLSKKLSKKTISYIKNTLKKHELSSENIIIAAFPDSNKSITPAATTGNTIYINEIELNKLGEPERQFILAHEIQHMIYDDAMQRAVIEELIEVSVNQMAEEKNKQHPLLELQRFHERRADIMAVLKHPELAEGYLMFGKKYFKRCGDTEGLTHPTYTERIKLAENIIDYTNKYNNLALKGDFNHPQPNVLMTA